MLQAKQELRDGGGGGGGGAPSSSTTLDLSETSGEENMGRKRRPSEQDLTSSTTSQQQMGSYLLQSSAGSIPASHTQIPANIWMVANSNNHQVMSGDPIWTFPSVNNSAAAAAALYRGAVSTSGLHFMNFPPPMALLPGQQLSNSSLGGNSSGGGGGGNINMNMSMNMNMNEGHLSMLAGLSPYRPVSHHESHQQGSGSQSQRGGSHDRHDNTSHHS